MKVTALVIAICEIIGSAAITPFLRSEIVDFVISKYPQLSLAEIKEAFVMWSMKTLDAPKSAEMYNGQLTLKVVGGVLTAYKKRRLKVSQLLNRQISEQKEQLEKEQRIQAQKRAFEINFPKDISGLIARKADWRDIPTYAYQACLNRNYFKLTKEEGAVIFEDAKELAEIEINLEIEEKGFMRQTERDAYKEQKLPDKRKKIARKLAVYRKVIINPHFKIPEQ